MSTSFTVRLDTEMERKLSELTKDGQSRNAVIRYALDLAHRAQIEDRMSRESAALLKDPADLAEIRAARAAMGAGDAW
jgi:predicted transcriptional regulator